MTQMEPEPIRLTQEAREFLFGRIDYERLGMPSASRRTVVGLSRIRRFLRRLGDPQVDRPWLHIAGTKGKGSTAALIAAALRGAGYRTGMYSSPHLHRLEERFRIDGCPIASEVLTRLIDELRPWVAQRDSDPDSAPREVGLTFFELCTVLALLGFTEAACDLGIIEVGLGGRLDSTNVIRPRIAAITSISYDHMRQLGSTLEAIAGEKAGILKRGVPAVSGVEAPGPRAVIRRVAAQRRVRLLELGEEIEYRYVPPAGPLREPEPGHVEVRTWRREWGRLPLPLFGAHQAQNAAVALACLDLLAEQGWSIDVEAVCSGWSGLNWPGRVEIVERRPYLVLDGAHNAASAEALAETIRTCFPKPSGLTLVFGTSRDKDLEGQLDALGPLCSRVIATQYWVNPRALSAAEVLEAASSRCGPEISVLAEPRLDEALRIARSLTPQDGLILVTGSLFLIAEVRSLLLGQEQVTGSGLLAPSH